jgi:hypothetical protein
MLVRGVNDVGGDGEVVVQELCGQRAVREDPPTLAAARNTNSGFSCAKNAPTAAWSRRSSSALVRVTICVYPSARSRRTMALPTMPRCPAT